MSISRSFATSYGLLFFSVLSFLTSCTPRNSEQDIQAPETPPLSRNVVGFAVVLPSYAHVMDKPTEDGISLGFLRQGTVVTVKERRAIRNEDTIQLWLYIKGELDGWMIDSTLAVYDNESQAYTASEALRQ